MTDKEKQQIKQFRETGTSYAQIAQMMDLPVNSIKTFCRRNNIGSTRYEETEDPTKCQYCGKKIEQPSGRKRKRFCSDKCRMSWWNTHQDKVKRKANYEFTCACCGKKFISYGNKNRRYCSHSCYIEDRFGGGC